MRKNQAINVIIHTGGATSHALTDRVSEFHAGIIEHRLAQSNLTIKQKLTIIDMIIENLRSREIRNAIK